MKKVILLLALVLSFAMYSFTSVESTVLEDVDQVTVVDKTSVVNSEAKALINTLHIKSQATKKKVQSPGYVTLSNTILCTLANGATVYQNSEGDWFYQDPPTISNWFGIQWVELSDPVPMSESDAQMVCGCNC